MEPEPIFFKHNYKLAAWPTALKPRFPNVPKRRNPKLYLHPGLDEVQSEGQSLPHKHVGIMALVKRLLQLLQLPAGEVGPGSSPFATGTLFVWVPGICCCCCPKQLAPQRSLIGSLTRSEKHTAFMKLF